MVFPTVVMRPDNAQAISKLIKFLINLGPNHLKAMDYNIYYLVLNKYLTIKYKAENKNSKLMSCAPHSHMVASYHGGRDLGLHSSLNTDYSDHSVIQVIRLC